MAQPALGTGRLCVRAHGQVRYPLETPYPDGTTHVVFDLLAFVARLPALVPRPRAHLTRDHGVFGIEDNSPLSITATYTSAIVSATVELGGQTVATSQSGSAARYRQFAGFAAARDVFGYQIGSAAGFNSAPFRGLTPTLLDLGSRAFTSNAFASMGLPNPFPRVSFPFQATELRINFASPATQPLLAMLSTVTTTTVIPVPAAAWLFA